MHGTMNVKFRLRYKMIQFVPGNQDPHWNMRSKFVFWRGAGRFFFMQGPILRCQELVGNRNVQQVLGLEE
jgi:hypothetical protein